LFTPFIAITSFSCGRRAMVFPTYAGSLEAITVPVGSTMNASTTSGEYSADCSADWTYGLVRRSL
jgi:hypothetical protein